MIVTYVIVMNIAAYVLQVISYIRDCKKYGKERLVMKLPERFKVVFFVVTLPTVICVLAMRK